MVPDRQTVRRFFDPVEAAQIPRLTERVERYSRGATVASLTVGSLVQLSELARGRADGVTTLVLWGATALLLGPVLFLPRAFLRSRAEWVTAYAGVFSMIALLVTGYVTQGGPHLHYLPYTGVVPIVYSALVPWRPAFALGLGLLAAALTAAAGSTLYGASANEVEMMLLVCLALAGVAAWFVQGRRLLWRELEQTEARARLVATDRLAHLGRLSGTLAHEVKTPLATTQNQLLMARSLMDEMGRSIGHPDVTDDDLREITGELDAALQGATSASQLASRLIQSLRDQTRTAGPGAVAAFRVSRHVETIRLLLKGRLRGAGIGLEFEGDDHTLVGVPLQFDQVVTNLVKNGIDAMQEAGRGGRITVRGEGRTGGYLLIVSDEGAGVPTHLREQIFEQGFSTKQGDHGLGLGLWICRNMIESSYGGRLTLLVSEGGAQFACWFPKGGAAGAEQAATAA